MSFSTIIQATNLVLLLANGNADMRKFIVWRTDGDKPVEVLQNAQFSRIAVEDNAKLFEHPLETGAVIVDHEIFEPKRANAQAYISNDDAQTLKELEYLYMSGTPLKIRAGNKIIDKVVISSKPFEISGAILDKTLYSISFKEAPMVTPLYVKLNNSKSASNVSRVNSGVKQAKPVKKSWILSIWEGGRTN